ncbi:MAG TPA: hypothetical protein VLH39_06885 [Magnetospirillaceae bacterium]|nr:hypothetical protein [Magnetospirillaceae bacterium]
MGRKSCKLVLLLAASSALASCGGDSDLRRLFDLEERAMRGAPPSTIEELRRGIAEYTREADRTIEATERIGIYWRLLSLRFMERRMYIEAYDAAKHALRYFPDNPALYYTIGLGLSHLAKLDSVSGPGGQAQRAERLATAETAYRRALHFNPRYARALYALAILYVFELDSPEVAGPYLVRLLDIETQNVDAMFLLARVRITEGRLEDAISLYDKIIRVTRVEERRRQAEENKKVVLDLLYDGGRRP